MRRFNTTTFIIAFFTLFTFANANAQCNTNTTICTSGMAGPYTFHAPGAPVSSCLDFWGPGYAYIILYITQSGPLEMLIDGNATTGYLDVSIFNIPTDQDPCTAIADNANEISCNYASSASGCNQIGTYFSCSSSVPAPYVNAGERLMIVVENWSNASTEFTLQLAPSPAAQTGAPDATILAPSGNISVNDIPFQMTAVDMGGTWSGPGISSSGMFDPAVSGSGVFTINYTIGSGPCTSSSSYDITVQTSLAVEMKGASLNCENDVATLNWETATEKNCDKFIIEKSRDGETFEEVGSVQGHGTSALEHSYEFIDYANGEMEYYQIVEVDYDGTRTIYGPFHTTCTSSTVLVYPNPASEQVTVQFDGFHKTETAITCYDNMGRLMFQQQNVPTGELSFPVNNLSNGLYTIIVQDGFTRKATQFSKL